MNLIGILWQNVKKDKIAFILFSLAVFAGVSIALSENSAAANAATKPVVEAESYHSPETYLSSPLIGRTVRFSSWPEDIEGKVVSIGFTEGGNFTLLVLKNNGFLCTTSVQNHDNIRVIR